MERGDAGWHCDYLLRQNSPPGPSQVHFGKSFADGLFNSLNLLGTYQPPLNTAANAVQQFEPVLKQGLLHALPLIESALPDVKLPLVAHMMRVNLEFLARLVRANPANFSLGHCVVSSYAFASSGQLDASDGHRGDAFAASDEAHVLIGCRLDADTVDMQSERGGDVLLHRIDVWGNLWLLGN